jgi:hypothetical protein
MVWVGFNWLGTQWIGRQRIQELQKDFQRLSVSDFQEVCAVDSFNKWCVCESVSCGSHGRAYSVLEQRDSKTVKRKDEKGKLGVGRVIGPGSKDSENWWCNKV